mgnify:CR=1 FL=1
MTVLTFFRSFRNRLKTIAGATSGFSADQHDFSVVATDGSTSMEKVIGSLKETFEADNKGINVTYNPTGYMAMTQTAASANATNFFVFIIKVSFVFLIIFLITVSLYRRNIKFVIMAL